MHHAVLGLDGVLIDNLALVVSLDGVLIGNSALAVSLNGVLTGDWGSVLYSYREILGSDSSLSLGSIRILLLL